MNSIGKELVKLSKSPFVDDEWLINSIDLEIKKARNDAKYSERMRIEKMISKMTDEELNEAVKNCKFLHQEIPQVFKKR